MAKKRKKRRKSRGKGKGSKFERAFCVRLSEWWSRGKRDDLFWRATTSGARATVRGRQGKKTHGQHGDVAAIHPRGVRLLRLVTFELKTGYHSDPVQSLLDNNNPSGTQKWEKWLEQAQEASRQSGSRYWIIVHQRLRKRAVAVMPYRLAKDLQLLTVQYMVIGLSYDQGKRRHGEKLFICLLDDLFDMDPKMFKQVM